MRAVNRWLQVATGTFLALAGAAAVSAHQPSTEIRGSVTARRDCAVQVSFEARADVGPAVGDGAAFTARIDGIEIDAGRGDVVDVTPGLPWVRVSQGRPALGHEAVIHATGRPVDEPASPPSPIERTAAPTPPQQLGLVRHRIDGVGQFWLPRHLTPRVEREGPYWTIVANAEGRAAGDLRVTMKKGAYFGDDQAQQVGFEEVTWYVESARLAEMTGDEFDRNTLWTGRRIRGPMDCFSGSYVAGAKKRKKTMRLWGVTCFGPDPAVYYTLGFVARVAKLEADADSTVEWIVRSLAPEP
jgi:hypothetical protein